MVTFIKPYRVLIRYHSIQYELLIQNLQGPFHISYHNRFQGMRRRVECRRVSSFRFSACGGVGRGFIYCRNFTYRVILYGSLSRLLYFNF